MIREDAVERIQVCVHAEDPITHAGVTVLLSGSDVVTVVEPADADVLVVAHDDLTCDDVILMLQHAQVSSVPVVLVLPNTQAVRMLTSLKRCVMTVVPRSQATGDVLARTVVSVARGASESPQASASGLSDQEIDVLKLVAHGPDPVAVGEALWYSNDTVEDILGGVLARMNLKNRAQAVAYAVRVGAL